MPSKKIVLVGHTPLPDVHHVPLGPNHRRHRIFLLSPANISGERAKLLLRESARFPLAQRLQSQGAPLGDVFSFISGLYFRGKLAYARTHANPPPTIPGVVVITAARGLWSPERIVTRQDLIDISSAPVDAADPRYRIPLEHDARILCDAMGEHCEAVLLGSIATSKYVEPLSGIFGSRLMFPVEFLGRGDMSRGALMLRCAREAVQLHYSPVVSLESKNSRSAKSASTSSQHKTEARKDEKRVRSAAREAVIFVGIQASGKTSFYRLHFADSHVHISLDVQRTRMREEQQFAACLKEGKSFVIDNTNPLHADRARYISRAREAGFRVVAYFFSTNLKDAIRRNNLPTGRQKVPVPVIAATLRKLQPPTLDEGFDSIYSVEIGSEDTFAVMPATAKQS
jgi:predicted kinase